MRLGALEAGGTKMVCAVGNEQGEIFEQISIPTETPEITIPRIIEYFKDKNIDALGTGKVRNMATLPAHRSLHGVIPLSYRDLRKLCIVR